MNIFYSVFISFHSCNLSNLIFLAILSFFKSNQDFYKDFSKDKVLKMTLEGVKFSPHWYKSSVISGKTTIVTQKMHENNKERLNMSIQLVFQGTNNKNRDDKYF